MQTLVFQKEKAGVFLTGMNVRSLESCSGQYLKRLTERICSQAFNNTLEIITNELLVERGWF